ncbi:hypothetical protein EHM92_06375 [bacterium]|nr:MAG: hypothetical protein EHM92_06375 [bacterium]
MNDWKRATRYFLLGYLIATIGGVLMYYLVSETVMWLFTMTVMPALFLILAYKYFRKNLRAASPFFDRDLLSLIVCWVALSCIMDAIVYVLLSPLLLGLPPNWTFFSDQSPWIWMNYITIILIVLVAKGFYYEKKRPQINTDAGRVSRPGHH